MGSTTLITMIVLLFVGMVVAVVRLKGRSREIESSIIPLPRIGGMALQHGPWPACIGIDGDDCAEMIATYALDATIEIITPEMEETLSTDFDPHRVRIHVDSDGIVTDSPVRGH